MLRSVIRVSPIYRHVFDFMCKASPVIQSLSDAEELFSRRFKPCDLFTKFFNLRPARFDSARLERSDDLIYLPCRDELL